MTDFALFYNENGILDYQISNGALVQPQGFETALDVSLLSDARADASEQSKSLMRRGWIVDLLNNENIGSKLWLVEQVRSTVEIREKVLRYVREALQVYIDRGVVESVNVSLERVTAFGFSFLVSVFSNGNEESTYYNFVNATSSVERVR